MPSSFLNPYSASVRMAFIVGLGIFLSECLALYLSIEASLKLRCSDLQYSGGAICNRNMVGQSRYADRKTFVPRNKKDQRA